MSRRIRAAPLRLLSRCVETWPRSTEGARRKGPCVEGRMHRQAAMGLGFDLGPCSVGNMGSIRRFDYSILGDTVNLASRLDGVTKTFRTDIVASGAVRDAVSDFAWLNLGEVLVVGKSDRQGFRARRRSRAIADSYVRWRNVADLCAQEYLADSKHAAEGASRWRIGSRAVAALLSLGAAVSRSRRRGRRITGLRYESFEQVTSIVRARCCPAVWSHDMGVGQLMIATCAHDLKSGTELLGSIARRHDAMLSESSTPPIANRNAGITIGIISSIC